MKFWWFKFEGWFSDDSSEYAGEGVFSECLVQKGDQFDAEFEFLAALAERKINLIEIEDRFLISTDPNDIDYENPDNQYWLDWCNETEAAGHPTFEAFHLYPATEVERNGSTGN